MTGASTPDMLEARFASKAPFPWFGGKSRAADLVWSLLGDVDHYAEPFAGSLAVLLGRPHLCNRPYFSETVNDLDGFICNAWRAIAQSPDATAEAASWPVSECDKSARQIALLKWRDELAAERLAGDALWHDPVMAGWWLWAVAVQIGAFTGDGPWTSDPKTGRIIKMAREPRAPGVRRDRPQLTSNSQGVNGLREPGVSRGVPHLSHSGQGVNGPAVREPGVEDQEQYHPTTMPKLRQWFALISARLRHVRILNGDWTRLCTTGALHTLSVRQGGHVGVFLDPPYDSWSKGLYVHDNDVAGDVRQWCIRNGDNRSRRIVLAGFDDEHGELTKHGWREHEWFVNEFLTGGMGDQQHRERLWSSPHCLEPTLKQSPQLTLEFDLM